MKEFVRRVCEGEPVVYRELSKVSPRSFRLTEYDPARGLSIRWEYNNSGFARWTYSKGRCQSTVKGMSWWYELSRPRSVISARGVP
jgi:hypothetical protein